MGMYFSAQVNIIPSQLFICDILLSCFLSTFFLKQSDFSEQTWSLSFLFQLPITERMFRCVLCAIKLAKMLLIKNVQMISLSFSCGGRQSYKEYILNFIIVEQTNHYNKYSSKWVWYGFHFCWDYFVVQSQN